jgi:uncharacterized protein
MRAKPMMRGFWRVVATLMAVSTGVSCQQRQATVVQTTEPIPIWAALAPDFVTGVTDNYSRQIPDRHFERKAVVRTSEVVSNVARAKGLGLAQSDVAYIAFRKGTDAEPYPHESLRGIAVLWVNYAVILVRRDSPIHEISDLRGKRIAVNPRGTASEFVMRSILSANGLSYDDLQVSFGGPVARLRDGTTDAWTIMYPTIDSLIWTDKGAALRLLPVKRSVVQALQGEYPFLRGVKLQPGESDSKINSVETVGADLLLVCNKDLDDDLVYQLTREFFKALPTFAKKFPEAAQIDIERAPSTPIPLHPGAARYYREREILR